MSRFQVLILKSVVKKMFRCGRNSLKMNKLGKEPTYRNENREFYPEFFSFQGVEEEGNEVLFRIGLKRKTGTCPVCKKKAGRIPQYQERAEGLAQDEGGPCIFSGQEEAVVVLQMQ
jgi:hypothetical protein